MSIIDNFGSRLKFRIWHKNLKRFLTGEEWYLNMDGKLGFAEFPMGNGDNAANSVFTPVINQERFVIEQCTGALDKNKKLIYEGDIVKVKRCFSRPKVIERMYRDVMKHEIDYEFHEGEEEVGHLFWSWCSHKWMVSYEWKHYDDFDDFSGVEHRHEVIGNIHENGELVKYEE
jgi:uncharacterized phage protein (TIGR01671 family)